MKLVTRYHNLFKTHWHFESMSVIVTVLESIYCVYRVDEQAFVMEHALCKSSHCLYVVVVGMT